MQDELRKIDRILEIDEDPKVVLFDHIEEEEAKMAELEEKVSDIQEFVEDAVASKIDGKDGESIKGDKGDQGERGEKGDKGEPGYTPIKGKDYFDGLNGLDGETPEKGVDYFDGEKGEKGEKGDKGDKGDMPRHEWDGAAIRFELPNGEWGEWMNLRGKDGKNGQTYSIFGGGGGIDQSTADNRYVKKTGDTMTGDLVGKSFIPTRDGTITRTGNYISSVALTGGRTLTITRDANNYITSINDGTRTYSFTRNGSNQITSWTVT